MFLLEGKQVKFSSLISLMSEFDVFQQDQIKIDSEVGVSAFMFQQVVLK